MNCVNCNFEIEDCVCLEVIDFMEENQDLMDDLDELEASEKKGAKRCNACYFFRCTCKRGHRARLERL